jgi:hypothetical protein
MSFAGLLAVVGARAFWQARDLDDELLLRERESVRVDVARVAAGDLRQEAHPLGVIGPEPLVELPQARACGVAGSFSMSPLRSVFRRGESARTSFSGSVEQVRVVLGLRAGRVVALQVGVHVARHRDGDRLVVGHDVHLLLPPLSTAFW